MPYSERARSGSLALIMAVMVGAAGCGGTPVAIVNDDEVTPRGADTAVPFPIDRGGNDATTPGSYQGLPLRLVANGAPVVTPVNGLIGFVCIGMSNGVRECDDFRARVGAGYANAVNPQVRIVNCAVGNHAIEKWIDPSFDSTLWDACISQKIPAAGLRPDQVRVVWHKAADQFNTGPGGVAKPPYPDAGSDYFAFYENLTVFAARVPNKFPSVQAVYTSSRSYGGFAGNGAARGEPLSYEEGHALNQWLASHRTVGGVWYGWAAYLWAPSCASGITNAGGICYNREDFVDDGVHPSSAGQQKISQLLHERFMKEAWYARLP